MKKRKLEHILISEFKVGDIYLYGGDYPTSSEYKITRIAPLYSDSSRVTLTLEWTGKGRNRNRSLLERVRRLNDRRYRVVYVERSCYPCYDSDCACIYDDVPEECTDY